VIDDSDLVHSVAKRLPNLQRLCLAFINLPDGSWEGVVEGLRRHAHPHYFNHGNGSGDLTHCKGVSFLRPKPESDAFSFPEPQPESNYSYMIKKDLERYAVEGGRHLCLPSGRPTEISIQYWLGLSPLGQRS